MTFSPNGEMRASMSSNSTLTVWKTARAADVKDRTSTAKWKDRIKAAKSGDVLKFRDVKGIHSFKFSANGSTITTDRGWAFTGGGDRGFYYLNIPDHRCSAVFENVLAFGDSEGVVWIFEALHKGTGGGICGSKAQIRFEAIAE